MIALFTALAAVHVAVMAPASSAAAPPPPPSAETCVERHQTGWIGPRFQQQGLDAAGDYALRLIFTGSPKAADEAMGHFTKRGHKAFYFLGKNKKDATLIAEIALKEPLDESDISLEAFCRAAADYKIEFDGWLFSKGLRHLSGYIPE